MVKLISFLFIMGAALGPVMDGFHTHSGTTYYPHVWLLKMDWWVPFLFGSAAVAVGLTHLDLDRRLGKHYPDLTWLHAILAVGCFAAIYFLSGFLSIDPTRKLVTLYTLAFLVWYVFDKTNSGLAVAIVSAVVGCAVEIALIAWGKFFYVRPDLWGIPYWLPALYIAASVSVGNTARMMKRKLQLA